MIATVGDASPRQARGHIGDGFVKWKHFLNNVADVADQTGMVRGRIERAEMSSKLCFHMIITVIVSICRRLIGDTSPKRRRLLRSYGNQALPVLRMNQTDELATKHVFGVITLWTTDYLFSCRFNSFLSSYRFILYYCCSFTGVDNVFLQVTSLLCVNVLFR